MVVLRLRAPHGLLNRLTPVMPHGVRTYREGQYMQVTLADDQPIRLVIESIRAAGCGLEVEWGTTLEVEDIFPDLQHGARCLLGAWAMPIPDAEWGRLLREWGTPYAYAGRLLWRRLADEGLGEPWREEYLCYHACGCAEEWLEGQEPWPLRRCSTHR